MISTNDIQNQSITLDKLSPEVVDTLYNTVPIGTVIYSMRIDVPNGFLKADGTEYSRLQYPQFYDMLVANSLPRLTYTDWTTQYTTNSGNVGKFGLDETNKKFKMICLTDSFIRNTTTNSNIGNYTTAGLPNISGTYDVFELGSGFGYGNSTTGAFTNYKSLYGGGATGQHVLSGNAISFNASLSNSIYGSSTTVTPKNIQMNAYVCVYNSADDISHMSLSAFTYTDLSNITSLPISGTGTSSLTGADLKPGTLFTGPDVVVSSWRATDGTSWYRRYKSGWLEQGGKGIGLNSETSQTITFPIAFSISNPRVIVSTEYPTGDNSSNAIYQLVSTTNATCVVYCQNGVASWANNVFPNWFACGY